MGAKKMDTRREINHVNASLSLFRFRQIIMELTRTMVANTPAPVVVFRMRTSSSGVMVMFSKVNLMLFYFIINIFFRSLNHVEDHHQNDSARVIEATFRTLSIPSPC